MRGRIIGAVVRKELRETLRDRRTLFIMIVIPVLLYPLMMIAMEQMALFGQRSLEAAPVRVAVVGAAPEGLLRGRDITLVRPDGDAVAELRAGRVDAVLLLPEQWSADGSNRVRLRFDAARERSSHARGLVQQRLRTWSDSLVAERLVLRELPADFLTPLRLDESSIATAQDVGGYMLGRFLPLLLILMTVLGAFYPSIDLAAGEKERGTLEALLTVPVPSEHLVIGKFITAALLGLTAAALNLGSMLLTFQTGVIQLGGALDLQFQLPILSALFIFGVLALLAVLFSATFLGIAVRSHSFKEAQNALTPVYILSLVPAMLPMMPGITFTPGFALVPVAGVGFLFRDLMSGGVAPEPAIIAVAATAAYAALALVFAARAFGREDVLFGTGGGDATPTRRRAWMARWRAPGTAVPSAGAAVGLVVVVGLLFFYGARLLGVRAGETGILISQWGFLAAPALLFVLIGRYDARAALALRAPSPRSLGGAVLIAAGGIPIGWLIVWLQGFVLAIPWEFLQAMQQMMTADTPGRLLWLLLVVAITPAICEELVFRGVLLHGLRTRMTAMRSVVVSAAVFGAFHLSFESAIRFLPTLWLGLLLGVVVWRTRSIFAAMLMHVINNGVVVLLLAVPVLGERLGLGGTQPPWLLVGIAPLLLMAGLRLLPRPEAAPTD